MPRTRSLAWAELKIGTLAILAVAMAAALIFMLSGAGGFFWQRYSLKTVFPNVAGLGVGAPVRIAGVNVGSVTAIAFVGQRVEVTLAISKSRQPLVTTQSNAVVGTVSLLGEGAVDITASGQGTPIPEWGYVPTGRPAASIGDVATTATTSIEEATKLLQDIRGGRGTVGKLFTDDTLFREVNAFVSAAEALARNVNAGRGSVGRLLNNPAAAQALEVSLQNLEAVTARIRAGEGSLGRLLTDDSLGKSLTSTTANLDAITGRVSRGEGTAGKLVTDAELYNRINSMADRLNTVMAGLQQGDGTAGALLRDKQLYDNMNSAVGELRKLLQDISADPRKYLNVRVSLF
jgi:phospholipid/cholesterol/gamma-HCH transport system substrate-binding protein